MIPARSARRTDCACALAAYGCGFARRWSWRALLGCLLFACGDAAPSDAHAHHAHAGHAAALEDDFRGCPAGIPSVAPGLEVTGERLVVKVIDALPVEPERYLNEWTIEVRARDGMPVGDAELVRAETFMPVHGHDGRVRPRLTALSEAGRFRVERLNFTMRGRWEVRLWLRSAALAEDELVFDVCVGK